MKNKITKFVFVLLNILFAVPSVVYFIKYKTLFGFNIENNFFLDLFLNNIVATITYTILFVLLMIFYSLLLKNDIFKNTKQTFMYIAIISVIYVFIVPWTSTDIFYYIGVGELDGVYHQNPYYVTMAEYYNENKDIINDEILESGAKNCWASTTVIYGPIAQMIFSFCSRISFKNTTLAIFNFKIFNLIIHMLNCYLIFKLCNKKIYSLMYGINPFILFELIGNVHNDVVVIFFVLLALYFVIKKKNIIASIVALTLATGIKYYTVLLLPVVVLYYFRDEKNVRNRIIKCVECALIFGIIYLVQYIPYFKDIKILFASFVQGEKYTKSIYAALINLKFEKISVILKGMVVIILLLKCIDTYISFLFEENKNISKMLRKYNSILILAILILSNCQIWYFSWLFPTIMWQSKKCKINIIVFSAITEIANFVYMLNLTNPGRSFNYVVTITILFGAWNIFYELNRKYKRNKLKIKSIA